MHYGYDMWSVGVLMLEVVMGSPHVWSLTPRTQALLERTLRSANYDEAARRTAYLLRAWMELCIFTPATLEADGDAAGSIARWQGHEFEKGSYIETGETKHGNSPTIPHMKDAINLADKNAVASNTLHLEGPVIMLRPADLLSPQQQSKKEGRMSGKDGSRQAGDKERGRKNVNSEGRTKILRVTQPHQDHAHPALGREEQDVLLHQGPAFCEGVQNIDHNCASEGIHGCADSMFTEGKRHVKGGSEHRESHPDRQEGHWSAVAPWECTEESLASHLKARDPLKKGLQSIWALRLLRRLLQWYPEDRVTAKEALQHAFLRPGEARGFECSICGAQFEFMSVCRAHLVDHIGCDRFNSSNFHWHSHEEDSVSVPELAMLREKQSFRHTASGRGDMDQATCF